MKPSQAHGMNAEYNNEATVEIVESSTTSDYGYESQATTVSVSVSEVELEEERAVARYIGRRAVSRRNRIIELAAILNQGSSAVDEESGESSLLDIFDYSMRRSILSQIFKNPELMKACKALISLSDEEQQKLMMNFRARFRREKPSEKRN
ncbi:hypothetical protein ACOME3_001460 [Neoechinorhynchus agilis]